MSAYQCRLATLELPGTNWVTCNVGGGTAFVLREDLDEVGGDPRWASFAVFLKEIAVPSEVSLADVVDNLMRLRVPQGYPDRFEMLIDGVAALGFEYTDGVSLLRTHFCTAPSGPAVELSFRSVFLPSGVTAEPLTDVAQAILSTVRWPPPRR